MTLYYTPKGVVESRVNRVTRGRFLTQSSTSSGEMGGCLEACVAILQQSLSRFLWRVISGRNHSRCERDSRYHLPRTRSYAIHHSQRNPVSMEPPRQKRNVETRVRGLWEDRPTHARLRRNLNRKRLHTLWTLLRLLVAERTRAREAGKRKPIESASDFVQKSLALRNEIVIAGESR